MTPQQLALVEAMPKRDMGLYGDDLGSDYDEEDCPDLVEADDVEAAYKKAMIKQQALKERADKREQKLRDIGDEVAKM
jgi:hypothetical protein